MRLLGWLRAHASGRLDSCAGTIGTGQENVDKDQACLTLAEHARRDLPVADRVAEQRVSSMRVPSGLRTSSCRAEVIQTVRKCSIGEKDDVTVM